MSILENVKKMFQKREEIYTPQREHIDRRHDALQRQLSYYQKKREIPIMERRIQMYEKEVYGSTMHTKDSNNILKVPYAFKWSKNKSGVRRR
jgi:hypothetical protein